MSSNGKRPFLSPCLWSLLLSHLFLPSHIYMLLSAIFHSSICHFINLALSLPSTLCKINLPFTTKPQHKVIEPFKSHFFLSLSFLSMDSTGSAEFLLSPSALHSVYCQAKQEDEMIDLGLSLRTLQPDATFHPPPQHLGGLERYTDVINWPHSDGYLKNSKTIHSSSSNPQDGELEETEAVESSRRRWAYVKVNMDGVVVGRKVCIFEGGCYSNLALQLEDMFGRQCESGLKLFETESEFSLFYKDGEENWRSVGDVPWKEFAECVKRLRIARKDEAFVFIRQN